MRSALRFLVLASIKILSRLFYRFSVQWVGGAWPPQFENLRLIMILNHTSLFEPIFMGVIPWRQIWDLAHRGAVPGADITLNRPLAGTLYKIMMPDVVTITRKRDASWDLFLDRVRRDSLILIAPEGRMKRPTGLDKDGNPMTVRGGIADLLQKLEGGTLLIAYSGGLHHVQVPGQTFPHLFKRVSLYLEYLEVDAYKQSLGIAENDPGFKAKVIQDLERRRDFYCAKLEEPQGANSSRRQA